MASLLEDGVRRADDYIGERFTDYFKFHFGDSLTYLTKLLNLTSHRGLDAKDASEISTRHSNGSLNGMHDLDDLKGLSKIPGRDGFSNETYELPDVIYLDPMFPKSKNTAMVRKNTKFLQNILPTPDTTNEEQLIRVALQCCRKRVVVKRPAGAPCLGNLKTKNFVKSRRYRFDIYTPQMGLKP